MPIWEYLCRRCRRIFSFHSFSPEPKREPTCPKCGATGLERVPSRFGIGPGSSKTGGGADGDDDVGDERMEREMMRLASELEGIDEDDPRQMAKAVRRMTELAGEPVTPAMEEMIRRMEAGEDPEELEEELGDALEEEMGDDGGGMGGYGDATRDDGLYPM